MSPTAALGLALGLMFGGSLLLLIAAARGWRPSTRALLTRRLINRDRSNGSDTFLNGRDQTRGTGSRRWVLVAAVGIAVAALTRWPVAAIAAAVLVYTWPRMFGAGKAATAQLARLEGLATWTESLRDSIAGSVGLEEAIAHSLNAAPKVLVPHLERLTGQLRVRVSLPQALERFAGELDDPSADLVVGALILNARLRGPGLVATLTALATSTREELDLRRRIEEGRKALRRTALIIVGFTALFASGLAVFSREYVAPYSTPTGQFVLAIVVAVFALGLMWIRSAAELTVPERFLAGTQPRSETPRPETTGDVVGGVVGGVAGIARVTS